MNPTKLFVSVFCFSAFAIGNSVFAEPIRLYHSVGSKVYDVSRFDNGNPVLDTPVEGIEAPFNSGSRWTFSGELPLSPEYMSDVGHYRLRRHATSYSSSEQSPLVFAQLEGSIVGKIDWELKDKRDSLIVFGWFVDDRVTHIEVATPRGFSRFREKMKMEGIHPDGTLVAWLLDESGNPMLREQIPQDKGSKLIIAALNGDLTALKESSEGRKKALKIKDEDEKTLLMYASMTGRFQVIDYLIENGVDPFETDLTLVNALGIAAEGGWNEIAQVIASEKPKGSNQKFQYAVAAAKAFNEGHEDIAIHLLNLGADIGLNRKKAPERMLGLLVNERVKLAKWVKEKYEVDGSYSNKGFNSLHAIAGYADSALLEELVAEGASINEKTKKGLTPLLMACGSGNRNAICWFMENGGRSDVEEELDPILYAIRERAGEAVSCLIDYGVSINKEQGKGISPLMYACVLGEKDIAETLLEAGGLWLFSSEYSNSSLMRMLRLDSVELLEGMFDQGLQIDHSFLSGARLIEIADFYESSNVVSLLRMRDPAVQSKLVQSRKLATAPKIARRSNLEYPYPLQEKYGDIDVLLKMGVSSDGTVAAIEIDENVPDEIGKLVELSLGQWLFNPLDIDSESIATMKFKLPLRISLREENTFALDEVDELPKALFQIEPNYPYELKMQRIGGFVMLEWIIDEEGVVRFPKATKSSHRGFVIPAIQSIRASKWEPAKRNGVPVAVLVKQKMNFNP